MYISVKMLKTLKKSWHGFYTCLYDKNRISLTQVPSQCHIHARPKAHHSDLNPDLLYLSLPRVHTAQHSLYKELQKMFCLTGKTRITHFPDGDTDLFLN